MKIYICFLILASLAFGCKKNEFVLDYSGIKPIIIIPNGNWPLKSPYDPQPQDSLFGVTKLNLYARVSYAAPLDKPVKVIFKADQDLLNSYNAQWGSAYQLLPSDAYQVASLEVTIPAGAQQASIPITLIPEKIKGSQDYLIAFTITAAGGENFAANAKSIIFTMKGQ